MKIFIALLLIVFSAGLSGVGVPEYPARPARKIIVNNKNTIKVTAANAVVVLDKAAAARTTRFALTEFQYFIKGIFGKELPVVKAPVAGKINIFLGLSKYTDKAGISRKQFCPDSFVVKRQGKNIYLAGTDCRKANPAYALKHGGAITQRYDRGTQLAVYDFVERFAGVRMFFPGEIGTVIPKAKSITVPEANIFDRPDFILRRVSTWWDGDWYEKEYNTYKKFLGRKNLNHQRLRWGITNRIVCHGMVHFNYVERFGKSNPEYFALHNNGRRSNVPGERFTGLPCYNSGITEEIYKDIRSFFKGEPASVRKVLRRGKKDSYAWSHNTSPGYVDIMPQDNYSGCYCAKCAPLTRTKKKYPQYASELIWGHVIDWANRLNKEGIKGTLMMMSYTPYANIPKADIPKNVMVMVARPGAWMKNNPARMKQDNALVKAWAKKLGRRVPMWNYVINTPKNGISGVPQMSPRAIGEYYKNIAPWSTGAFAESESKKFIYNYLNYYMFAKIGWDTKADVEKILDDHHRAMFGKGAPFMKKFYDTLENIWINKIVGNVINTDLGPVTSMPSNYVIWEKLFNANTLKQFDQLFAKAKKAVPAKSIERKRIDFIEKEFLAPLIEERKNYMASNDAIAGLVYYANADEDLYLTPIQLDQSGPLPGVDTRVRFQKTAKDLKITFRCIEPRMSDIIAVKRKADDIEVWRDNGIELFLNPSCDRKNFYQFIINSEGCMADQAIVSLGRKGTYKPKWNSNAKVKVTKKAKEWIAEITIPLSSLPGLKDRMVANICRNRILKGKQDFHRFFCFGPFVTGYHNVENYGTISFEADRNIIPNGDFSQPKRGKNYYKFKNGKNLGGWIGNPKCSLDFNDHISPPASMKISGKNPMISHYFKNMKPGKRYRLSFYMKTKGVKLFSRGGGACANYANRGNNWYPQYKPSGDTPWRFYQVVYTAKDSKTPYLWLRVMGEGTAWFDNVRMEELQ